uniref:Uncharacterized protein n=1 Tax=Cucumis melo TaxID=3656 RepID=A0A9I9EGD4_CUCME
MCGGRTEPPTLSLITTNHTCKSPWPSALKVTEGGDGCRAIRTLDPGHSRSSIASFSAADWVPPNRNQDLKYIEI